MDAAMVHGPAKLVTLFLLARRKLTCRSEISMKFQFLTESKQADSEYWNAHANLIL